MSFFSWLFNGLGTVLGVIVETVSEVFEGIRNSYGAYRSRGGAVEAAAADEGRRQREHLREVNEEIMGLRNAAMSRGGLSDHQRRRWRDLRDLRDELLGKLNETKEVKAAETILESESSIDKVEIDLDTTHFLQYNAFADILGKNCPKCVFRTIVTGQSGIVTGDFGIVTERSGIVTEGCQEGFEGCV